MEKIHILKIWPEFYEKVISGEKTFELRKDDRGFRAGEYLYLREYQPYSQTYTGRSSYYQITYLMSGWGLEKGWVVMSIKPISREELHGKDTAAG